MIKFTLWGLYQYDSTLFNNAPVPDGIDKQMLIDTIMDTNGDLYCYYQQPERFKLAITNWFRRHELGFARMLLALNKEYDPLENYDRYENETTTPNITRSKVASGTDTNTLGGKDSTQLSGTDSNSAGGRDTVTTDMNETTENTGKVSAFDSSNFENKDHTDNVRDTDGTVETAYGRTDATTYGRKDETTYGRTDSTTYGRTDTEHETGNTGRELHAHGQIGVTQYKELIENEIALRKFDLYKTIALMFEDDLLIQVY